MINKEKAISIVKELGLTGKYHYVFMGGSLAMREMRSTEDLDIGVEATEFIKIMERFEISETKCYEAVLKNKKFDLEILGEKVEVFEIEKNEEYDTIEGVNIQKIEDIVKLKKALGREKDMNDLKLIEKAKG